MNLLIKEEREQVEAKKPSDAVLEQEITRLLETAPNEPVPRELALAVLERLRDTLELERKVVRRRLNSA